MPTGLKRYYGNDHLHYITFSCHRHRKLLSMPERRDLFLQVLEETRRSYRFVVVGYVVMPDHVHLLIGEPERGTQSTVIQVVKQRFVHKLLRMQTPGRPALRDFRRVGAWSVDKAGEIWNKRFYDFPVWSEKKRVEKLRYMHENPVRAGLVLEPQQWPWSSYRAYIYDEPGPVLLNEKKPAVMKIIPGSLAAKMSGE